ncbi:MAG: hypothetical protein ACTSRB_18395 [Candidatus Helarchaeota archaeon]
MSEELLEIRKTIARLNLLAKKEQYFEFQREFRPCFEQFCNAIGGFGDDILQPDLDSIITKSRVPLALLQEPEKLKKLADSIEKLKSLKKEGFWISNGIISKLGKQIILFLKGKKDKFDAIEALMTYLEKLMIF